MSRTYRLRHDPSKLSHRFADGRFTLHIEVLQNYWKAIVAHGLWNLQCINLGQKILEYGLTPYGWFDVNYHSHDTCWQALGDSWHGRHTLLHSIIPGKQYEVASMHYHEYAHPGRRSGRGRSYRRGEGFFEKKGNRKEMSVRMRHVNVTLDDNFV